MGFRHEFKHSISQTDRIILNKRLAAVTFPDKNTNELGEYKIRSLYFDNPEDRALREKLDSVNNREKFRIRYYNNNPDFIRLEKKIKINGLSKKFSAVISKTRAEDIINGNYAWMIGSSNRLINEFYLKIKTQQLKPKTIVDYIREAYVYPYGNVRVTIDRDIRTCVYHTNLFDLDFPSINPQEDFIILEIKYDAFLPEVILDIVQLDSRRTAAFSKYASCRIFG